MGEGAAVTCVPARRNWPNSPLLERPTRGANKQIAAQNEDKIARPVPFGVSFTADGQAGWISLPTDKRRTREQAKLIVNKAIERIPSDGNPHRKIMEWLLPRTTRGVRLLKPTSMPMAASRRRHAAPHLFENRAHG